MVKQTMDLDRAVARVPKWIGVLGLMGTGLAGILGGLPFALSFMAGAVAAWLNFLLIERFVSRLGEKALEGGQKPAAQQSFRMFIRLLFIGLGAFVILRFTGVNIVAALSGLLVCPAAVILEIIYELIIYGHS
jgi:hypothetical protein